MWGKLQPLHDIVHTKLRHFFFFAFITTPLQQTFSPGDVLRRVTAEKAYWGTYAKLKGVGYDQELV